MTLMMRTRFAPSPTGFLHLGSVRTALFNWLLARHFGGAFFLRMEDTDVVRGEERYGESILEGLQWLGLDWREIFYQSQQQKRHREVAFRLFKKGYAYWCDCPPPAGTEEGYQRKCRQRCLTQSAKTALRFKAPVKGKVVIADAVQGQVVIQAQHLDDMVLLRSDETPTYMLCVVVDDHDMGITHILRGTDHLINAARQIQVYDALGWTPPNMAHIPLICSADGRKLSKRHGAKDVRVYQREGFLPLALHNALFQLGWRRGDAELISLEDAALLFDLKKLHRASARFSEDKLLALNRKLLQTMDASTLCHRLEAYTKTPLSQQEKKRLSLLLPEALKRTHSLKGPRPSLLLLTATEPPPMPSLQ